MKDVLSYPMGPTLRTWIGAAHVEDSEKATVTPEQRDAFATFMVAVIEKQEFSSEEQFSEILFELFAMDFPLLVLKACEQQRGKWPRDSFDRLQVEAISALTVGELELAERQSFRAHEIKPEEPAPYVNLAQIFLRAGAYEDAIIWCEAGLIADPNHRPLWEVILNLEENRNPTKERLLTAIEQWTKRASSWVGVSLLDECEGHRRPDHKLALLQKFYAKGERSDEFLLEYTGTLGSAGYFSEVPPIVWQQERIAGAKVPWRLQVHHAQAHLAMGNKDAFRELVLKLKMQNEIPSDMLAELSTVATEEGVPLV